MLRGTKKGGNLAAPPFSNSLSADDGLAAGLDGVDIDAATVAIEAHLAVDEGEDGVIAAEADTLAWVPLGAALTDEDISSDDALATEFLHAAALAVGIASVLDAALSFFMGHGF